MLKDGSTVLSYLEYSWCNPKNFSRFFCHALAFDCYCGYCLDITHLTGCYYLNEAWHAIYAIHII